MQLRATTRAAVRVSSGLGLVGWRPALPDMRPAGVLKLLRPERGGEEGESRGYCDGDQCGQQRGANTRRLKADQAVLG